MAKKEKPGNTHAGRFKKGQSGNPSGRTKTPKDIQLLKDRWGDGFYRALGKYAFMPYPELASFVDKNIGSIAEALTKEELQKSPSALDVLAANFLSRTITTACPKRLGLLLERMMGKVAQPLHHGGADGEPLPGAKPADLSIDQINKMALEVVRRATKEE